jgi:rhomboid protease GluP
LWLFSYGKLQDQPVVFEVIAATLSAEIQPEEMDAFLEEERKATESTPPANFTRKGPATRITAGGRPAIYAEYEKDALLIKSYIVVLGDREIILRGYSFKERPPAWNDVEAKVVSSLAKN